MTDHMKTLRDLVAAGEKATQSQMHVMPDGFTKRRSGPTVYATDSDLRYVAECHDFLEVGAPTPNLANAEFFAAAANARPALAAMLRVVEAAKVVCDAPGCAWCGNPAEAYVSRGIGEQEGDCCSACMTMFGRGNLTVRHTYVSNAEELRAALRELEPKEAEDA